MGERCGANRLGNGSPKVGKRGRPQRNFSDLDQKLVDDAIAMTAFGIPQGIVARHLGVSAGWLSGNAEMRELLAGAKDLARGRVIGTAYRMAVSGESPAMTIFYLKTQCGWREERETDGSPMPTLGSVDVS